jgi:thiol-disulfide isomerase/thioredoxin
MKYFVFIVFFSFCLTLHAQGLDNEPTLNEAFAKAKVENKLVFVEYFNADCPVCKRLEPLFSDSLMRAFYNKNFVNYKLDTQKDKREDKAFMDSLKLKPESVPMFFFFDKNKQFVHFSYTKQDVKYLLEIGEDALSPIERAANLATKYKAGDRTIRTLYAYSNLTQLYNQDSLRTVLANELFKAFPTANLSTKKSYTIMKHCVTNIENGFFQYWINHIEQLEGFEIEPDKGYKEKATLGKIISTSINSKASKTWDLEKIKAVKAMITKVELSDNPDVFLWQQEAYLLEQANRSSEALQLCHRLLTHPKTDIPTAAYYLDFFIAILTEKKDLDVVKKYLDEQASKATEAEDKASFERIKAVFLKKM